MTTLPKCCVDGEHRAALVVGRATCAAEDTMAATVVTPELLARGRASREPLVLEMDYC